MEIAPNLLIFGGLAGIAALSALGVVLFPSPVRSVMCLVVNFFVLAFLYFSLGAEALGIIQVVVYAGAIMVLFLFVVMLLNLGSAKGSPEKLEPRKLLAIMMGLGLIAMVGGQVLRPLAMPLDQTVEPRAPMGYGTFESIGNALWTNYAYPLELVGLLLLVGIIGSVILVGKRSSD